MAITIQKIWPLEGKSSGGFKGTDGRNYKCTAFQHSRLVEGMTLEVEPKPSDFNGKTYYWLPREYAVPAAANSQQPTQGSQRPAATAPVATGNGYVPEQEKQGYIMVSVMMKLLADAQTQAGKPVDTQDLPLLADAAVAVWRNNLKGKV